MHRLNLRQLNRYYELRYWPRVACEPRLAQKKKDYEIDYVYDSITDVV